MMGEDPEKTQHRGDPDEATVLRPGAGDRTPEAGDAAPGMGDHASADAPPGAAPDAASTPSSDPAPHATSADAERSSPAEQWIAGYRILGRLGEGGMGIVFEAEQQEPRRTVALKVIRGGAAVDAYTAQLFQREVATLARLRHPNIAAIYDAGCTAEGQRYFAMELVRGVPLDAYVSARPIDPRHRKAGLRERLELFLQICDAIHSAHQRGVIHRDLKPGNILVIDAPATGEGDLRSETRVRRAGPEVKILDFGLARIVDAEASGDSVVTMAGQISGTLGYMSPEQARGNPDEIDLRTDVYALGVVLFEVLTGERPYATDAPALPEAIRQISETPPRRPSALQPMLAGDLETILLKALEKEPARRYQSVLALAEDVERHLADQPILARPPSTVYQLRKLVARHRTPFAFGVGLLTVLIGFAITMSVMFGVQRRERLRADAARDRAETEVRKAERINSFLQAMLGSVDPEQARGQEVTVREVLDRAAQDIGRELDAEPEVQAALRNTIGTTYLALGLYEEAETQLRRSLAMHESLLGPDHPDAIASLAELGHLLNAQGHHAAAESVFTCALERCRRIHGAEHIAVATALSNLGLALRYQQRASQAEPLFREALGLRRALLGSDHRETAAVLNNLALTLSDLERYAEAEPLYREALAIQRGQLGEEHLEVARTINNLALLLKRTGETGEAQALYRRALAIQQELLGGAHPSIVVTHINLAMLHRACAEWNAAAEQYRAALGMARAVLGEEHPYVAIALTGLGPVLREQGALDEARRCYEEALAVYSTQYVEDHPYAIAAREGLAAVLLAAQEAEEAERLIRRCLEQRAATLEPGHWRLACDENLLAGCWAALGRIREAEELFLQSCARLASADHAPPDRRRAAYERAADFFEMRGMTERAVEYRREGMSLTP
ncbi:MAG: tetratricopeptide repeat protein [Candidatus Eisenbacteria bacterium]|nr:tetratricopeptide repeat protein [Candidatus Eisenbacteria bacterium]